MKQKVMICGMVVTLIIAVAAQAIPSFIKPDRTTMRGSLEEAVTRKIPGWEVRDVPLGDTESFNAKAHEILAFDDYIYREYTRGAQSFAVYAAYWTPGKMPVRQVNAHTPDRCWTWAGWRCVAMDFSVPIHSTGHGSLMPAEWRIFEKGHIRTHVVYWHIVGGSVHAYRNGFNEAPPVSVILRDLSRYGFNLRREQFFVRITSEQDLDEIWEDSGFQAILADLARLCLSPQSQASTAIR